MTNTDTLDRNTMRRHTRPLFPAKRHALGNGARRRSSSIHRDSARGICVFFLVFAFTFGSASLFSATRTLTTNTNYTLAQGETVSFTTGDDDVLLAANARVTALTTTRTVTTTNIAVITNMWTNKALRYMTVTNVMETPRLVTNTLAEENTNATAPLIQTNIAYTTNVYKTNMLLVTVRTNIRTNRTIRNARMSFLVVKGETYGPYDRVHLPVFDAKGTRFAFTAMMSNAYYVIEEGGAQHGPYRDVKPIVMPEGDAPWMTVVKKKTKWYALIAGEEAHVPHNVAFSSKGTCGTNTWTTLEMGGVYTYTDEYYAKYEKTYASNYLFVNGAPIGVYQRTYPLRASDDGSAWGMRAKKDDGMYLVVEGEEYGAYDEVEGPFFSEGGWYGKGVRSGEDVYLILAGGAEGPFKDVGAVAFATNGTYVAVVEEKDGWHLLRTDGSEGDAFETLFTPVIAKNGTRFGTKGKRDGAWYVIVDSETYGPYTRATTPAFSPDGTAWGASYESNGAWYAMLGETNYGPYTWATRPSFSFDGSAFALGVSVGKTWSFLTNGGQPRGSYAALFGPFHSAHDGTWAAFTKARHSDTRWTLLVNGYARGTYDVSNPLSFGKNGTWWYTGYNDKGYHAVVNGRAYGPFDEIVSSRFSEQGVWCLSYREKGDTYALVAGRRFGPYYDVQHVRIFGETNVLFIAVSSKDYSRALVVNGKTYAGYTTIDPPLLLGGHWATLAYTGTLGTVIIDGDKMRGNARALTPIETGKGKGFAWIAHHGRSIIRTTAILESALEQTN